MAIVFDTYAWVEYFNGTSKGNLVKRYLEREEILTPIIVLLELSYKADKECWNFDNHLKFIKANSEIVGMNEEFVLLFGKFYNRIKKKVKKIGITDIIIIHTANVNNAKILTGDPHFKEMNNVIML